MKEVMITEISGCKKTRVACGHKLYHPSRRGSLNPIHSRI